MRPRFSLATLTIMAALAGSAFSLWYHWEPWVKRVELFAKDVGTGKLGTTMSTALEIKQQYGAGLTHFYELGNEVRDTWLQGMKGEPFLLAFSPDRSQVLTNLQGAAETPVVWDIEGKKTRLTLPKHDGTVWNLDWSSDGKRLLSATSGGLFVWDAESGNPLWSSKEQAPAEAYFAEPPERIVVHCGDDVEKLEVSVLNAADGTCLLRGRPVLTPKVFEIQDRGRTSKNCIAVRGQDDAVEVWDLNEMSLQSKVPVSCSNLVYALLSRDALRLLTVVSGEKENHGQVWDTRNGAPLFAFWIAKPYVTAPYGRNCFSGNLERTLRVSREDRNVLEIVETRSGRLCNTMRIEAPSGGDMGGPSVGISEDGRQVYFHNYESLYRWELRRDESPNGILDLKEFWLTLVLFVALIWSIWRDVRSIHGQNRTNKANTPP